MSHIQWRSLMNPPEDWSKTHKNHDPSLRKSSAPHIGKTEFSLDKENLHTLEDAGMINSSKMKSSWPVTCMGFHLAVGTTSASEAFPLSSASGDPRWPSQGQGSGWEQSWFWARHVFQETARKSTHGVSRYIGLYAKTDVSLMDGYISERRQHVISIVSNK